MFGKDFWKYFNIVTQVMMIIEDGKIDSTEKLLLMNALAPEVAKYLKDKEQEEIIALFVEFFHKVMNEMDKE